MTITTPSGHVVELKDMVTYGDQRAVRRVIQSGMKVDIESNKRMMAGDVLMDAEETALRRLVIAVTPKDGQKITDPNQILDLVYSWPPADGTAVFQAVNKLTTEAESPKVNG